VTDDQLLTTQPSPECSRNSPPCECLLPWTQFTTGSYLEPG